jgi:Protein of unknown function (DUF3565)
MTFERRIVGFHQDEFGDWVADFNCGHGRHMRHNPPCTNRPWVITEAGRASRLGAMLVCQRCQAEKPQQLEPDG